MTAATVRTRMLGRSLLACGLMGVTAGFVTVYPVDASQLDSAGLSPIAHSAPALAHPEALRESKDGVLQDPSRSNTDAAAMSSWLRYGIWIVLGVWGGTGLGMILSGDRNGWISLLLVLGLAAWSLYRSWTDGTGLGPPLVALALLFLWAGPGARASRIVDDR